MKLFSHVRYNSILNIECATTSFSYVFPVSRTVSQIGMLTSQFVASWRCERSHRVVHSHLILPRQHVDDYSCGRSEVNGSRQYFRGFTVFTHI